MPGAGVQEPGEAEQEDHAAVQRQGHAADQVAPGPPRAVDVGHPVGGAAQRVEHGGGERRDRRALDVVQERRAVGAHHEQRDQPPQGAQRGERRPPHHQAAPPGAGPPGQQPDRSEREHGRGGRGVDPAHHGHRQGGQRGSPARRPAAGAQHQRQQHPGRQRAGPGLDGDGSQGGQHPRGQGVGHAGQQAGQVRADAQCPRHPRAPGEGDRQHEAHPQPLHHPGRQVQRGARREERAHRPQVAVGLVLQLPEGALAVPQVQRPAQEPDGVQGEVELGVGDQQARVLDEGEADQEDHHRGRAQPGDRRGGRWGGDRYVLVPVLGRGAR